MNVCSWCISRLGGSPASATCKIPPRRGCSSASAIGVAHKPMSVTKQSTATLILTPCIPTPPYSRVQHTTHPITITGQAHHPTLSDVVPDQFPISLAVVSLTSPPATHPQNVGSSNGW